jgi:citrate lyase beta subunit
LLVFLFNFLDPTSLLDSGGIMTVCQRLRRSTLSVPANKERMIAKALGLDADVVMLDLEDSVPVEEKRTARQEAAAVLSDRGFGRLTRAVRINDMDSPFAYRDLIELVEQAGEHIDLIVLPKVEAASHVQAVDLFLTQLEKACGLSGAIGLQASIETARGMQAVESVASCSSRLESLVFGIADYAASLGMLSKGLSGHGEAEEFYPGHRWQYPLSRLAMAAKAAGLQAIDAPFGDFRDHEGLERSCLISAALGFDGKWAIHPDQIDRINRVFTPAEEDVARCRRIVEAAEEQRKAGQGALSLDGKMIDGASVRLAQATVSKWEEILRKKEGQ